MTGRIEQKRVDDHFKGQGGSPVWISLAEMAMSMDRETRFFFGSKNAYMRRGTKVKLRKKNRPRKKKPQNWT